MAQSRTGVDCERVVCILLHPFIGSVHRSVAMTLYLHKKNTLIKYHVTIVMIKLFHKASIALWPDANQRCHL
jgi:hypothetical protein